jgi:U2-associated protein SR140
MTDRSRTAATTFPDLSNKLSNPPSKKSLFERQKAEAEAKRQREEKETAAVYEDFVKSFDHDDENDELLAAVGRGGSGRGGFAGGRGGAFVGGGAGPGRRHFTSRGGKNSGPGSLGPSSAMRSSGPGSLGPAPSAPGGYRGQKRPFNEYGRDRDSDRERSHAMFSYNDHDRSSTVATSTLDAATAFHGDDDEDQKTSSAEKAAPKPTLHLSSLPPGTSPAFITSLIPASSVTVENVRVLPSNNLSQSSDRRSTSAIVALPPDTPATDIDTLVSQLQNKYLGFGFYLSISRHLSSAALGVSGLIAPTTSTTNLPFGARSIPQHTTLGRSAPPASLSGHRGGYAPPASYTSSTPYNQRTRGPPMQVIVNPPSDLKQLKIIHLTLEALFTYGPEFEALLMSRREVQRDEKWAWLWDARSRGGVYYRWRLWAISTDADLGGRRNRGGNGAQFLFENTAPWVPPDVGLKFEYTTKMEEFIEDEAYDSSDEEDYDDDARNQRRRRADQLAEGMGGGCSDAAAMATKADGTGYLNPLSKAKLIHLLARLPDSNTKLRRGDVARVTAFAIEHAGEGADEVASIITANVRRPLCFTSANPASQQHQQRQQIAAGDEPPSLPCPPPPASPKKEKEKKDTTTASLVALYLISDILMSSTTSGVRHAWRYRALFETALEAQRTFEYLGGVERELGWGRLKAEKWKRSVQNLLGMWEGWCVFPGDSQEGFFKAFVETPAGGKGERDDDEDGGDSGHTRKKMGTGKWKSVQDGGNSNDNGGFQDADPDAEMDDVDGAPMRDDDDDEALDGEPLGDEDDILMGNTDEDLDGEPMIDSSDEEAQAQMEKKSPSAPMVHERQDPAGLKPAVEAQGVAATDLKQAQAQSTKAAMGSVKKSQRRRPKAVDMFADESDEEG